MAERLVQRIYKLMLTQPDKDWTYDELGRILNIRKKIISSRCMDLMRRKLIKKVLVESGRPRGRIALVSIRSEEPEYPSWLCPNRKLTTAVVITAIAIHTHLIEDDDELDG